MGFDTACEFVFIVTSCSIHLRYNGKFNTVLILSIFSLSTMRYKGGSRAHAPPPPPTRLIYFESCFCIMYNVKYTIYFTLYSHYKKETLGYVGRGIKKIPNPQEFYRAPGSDIPGSATEIKIVSPLLHMMNCHGGRFLSFIADKKYRFYY